MQEQKSSNLGEFGVNSSPDIVGDAVNTASNLFSGEIGSTECVSLSVEFSDITKYYTGSGSLDMRDLVIYVRERVPNPYCRVILRTSMKLPLEALQRMLIYKEGENADKSSDVQGIEGEVYCIMKIIDRSQVAESELESRLSAFSQDYSVDNPYILVYGSSVDLLLDTLDTVGGSKRLSKYHWAFPRCLSDIRQIRSDGIDLGKHAEEARRAASVLELGVSKLGSIMDAIHAEVLAGKTKLQSSEQSRSKYTKLFTLTEIAESWLQPTYHGSFLSDYVTFSVAYPLQMMSMLDRIRFMDKLPRVVGIVLPSHSNCCYFEVAMDGKIYPRPTLIFDVKAQSFVPESEFHKFERENLKFADFRLLFPNSQLTKTTPSWRAYMTKTRAPGLVQKGNTAGDAEADLRLSEALFTMAELSGEPDVFPTLKNTVCARVDGRTYFIYYNESFGVKGTRISDVVTPQGCVIEESEFNKFIDIGFAYTICQQNRENEEDEEPGLVLKRKEQMLSLRNKFQFIVPPFVQMCAMVATDKSELTYYDRRMCCDKGVLPIVSHPDSGLSEQKTIFDFIPYRNIRRDRHSADIISAFGGINADNPKVRENIKSMTESELGKLQVSYESFKGLDLSDLLEDLF